MNRILNYLIDVITPLCILFLVNLIKGILTIIDPGEEGWGIIAGAITICFGLVVLLIDQVFKRFIKNKRWFWILQFVASILIIFLFIRWKVF